MAKCEICGIETGGEFEDLCDKHLDDAFVLLVAIMKAKSADDVITAWLTWKNGEGKNTTMFLDYCMNCGKLIWIARWERQNNRHGGQYCSRECQIEHRRNKLAPLKLSP
jgi:hypothetical protein